MVQIYVLFYFPKTLALYFLSIYINQLMYVINDA